MTTLRSGKNVRVFAIGNPSVVGRLSVVCNVRAPYSGVKLSAIFLRHFVPQPSFDFREKLYTYRFRGTPLSGALNARGLAKYSDVTFGSLIS